MLSIVKSPEGSVDPVEGLSISRTYFERDEVPSIVAFHLKLGRSLLVYELFSGLVSSIVAGDVVSIVVDPDAEYPDSFPAVSAALTLKYHTPSVRAVECVKEFVDEVDVDTPLEKADVCDHWTVYDVAASPEPLSELAVHVQVGVLTVAALDVDGVPGTDGAVESTLNAMEPELAVAYEL